MYQIYNLEHGMKIALPQESQRIALSLARLSSAINRTHTAVIDDSTGEVRAEFLEGLLAWQPTDGKVV